METKPIGVFDSGYGGLTVFRSIQYLLPRFDYIYLGDNARAPYGNRSFDTVFSFTLDSVRWLFDQGCHLIILACNTASAKALRTIQQTILPYEYPDRRVLGVIRPTAEVIGTYTTSRHIGILGTKGTIDSASYIIEVGNFYNDISVFQQACPLWVPIIESGDTSSQVLEEIIKTDVIKLFAQSPHIDTVLLACTHYPLVATVIQKHLPPHVRLVAQGDIVSSSLSDYLKRNAWLTNDITTGGTQRFYTTDDPAEFKKQGQRFYGEILDVTMVKL